MYVVETRLNIQKVNSGECLILPTKNLLSDIFESSAYI